MSNPLVSLAIIKANWDHSQKDYLDFFVPLISILIFKNHYSEIGIDLINKLCVDFETEYGLQIPNNPMISILTRMKKFNLLSSQNKKYIPNFDKLSEYNKSLDFQKFERELEKVIDELNKFIKEKYPDLNFAPDEINNSLINFLKKHDHEILSYSDTKSFLPDIDVSVKLEYIISEFILDSYKSEPSIFQFILDITIGHSLTGVILFNNYASYMGKLKKVEFYLDTPFIFDLLGISGCPKKILAEELIHMLNEQNAILYIMDITKNEITSNINQCQKELSKSDIDYSKCCLTTKNCHENNLSSSDVDLIFSNMQSILESYKISDADSPDLSKEAKYQIDEKKLYETIVNTYKELHDLRIEGEFIYNYNNLKATEKEINPEASVMDRLNKTILRDVSVISRIYRLRKSKTANNIKHSKANFITTNHSLAFATKKFELKELGVSLSIPACLTHIFIGTLIWLQSPAKIKNLNEKKLISHCYTSMKPSDILIQKYLNEIDKLKQNNKIDDEQYYNLRTNRTAFNLLEAKTLGDPDAITGSTSSEILAEFEYKLKQEEILKAREDKIKHEKDKKKLDEENSNLTNELSKTKQKLNKIENNIENKSQKIATIISKTIHISLYCLYFGSFIIGILSIIPHNLLPFIPDFIHDFFILKIIDYILFGMLAIIHGLYNISIKTKINNFENWIKKELKKYMKGQP